MILADVFFSVNGAGPYGRFTAIAFAEGAVAQSSNLMILRHPLMACSIPIEKDSYM